jgi:uncharacterized protein YeaO (DUF488 family)
MINMKRAYEPAEKKDGYRILIDRLWPRGVKKSKLAVDEWMKDLAPSTALRKSFGHDPAKWKKFCAKYRIELRAQAAREEIEALVKRARKSPVTLVYSARDEEHNNAVVLKNVLEHAVKKSRKAA